jgi:hypothetical protein
MLKDQVASQSNPNRSIPHRISCLQQEEAPLPTVYPSVKRTQIIVQYSSFARNLTLCKDIAYH